MAAKSNSDSSINWSLYPKGVTIIVKDIIATGYLPFIAILSFFCVLFYLVPNEEKKEVLFSCGDSMKHYAVLPWVLCIIIILIAVVVYRNGNHKKDNEIKRLQKELEEAKLMLIEFSKKK